MKNNPHNYPNYLRAILESVTEYNAVARLDVAKLLHEGHKIAIQSPTKHASDTLVLEKISKWMQVLEELSVLCMMFEKPLSPEEQVKMYVHTKNKTILQYLRGIKQHGFSTSSAMRLFGLKPATEYYKAGKINKAEVPYFREIISREIKSHKKTLRSIANAYAGKKEKNQKRILPSILLDIYFKTKHGFKVIHPTSTALKLWNIQPNEIAMIDKIISRKRRKPRLRLMMFPKLTSANVDLLIERIKGWSELMGKTAEIQLKSLDDPYWMIPHIRVLKTEELLKTHPKPGRNDDCLCGSEMKFKKCCEILL